MTNQIPQQSPDAQYRLRLIMWVAMLFSIAMYYVVARMVQPASPNDNPTMVTALLVLAAGLAVASFGVKSYFFKRARESQNQGLVRVGDLVAFVLCEAAALLGLVVWFLTASPQYYLFLILGAAGQLLHYPRRVD